MLQYEKKLNDFDEVVTRVKGFSMHEVKNAIENGKKEMAAEVAENMSYIKIIQDEIQELKFILENVPKAENRERQLLKESII